MVIPDGSENREPPENCGADEFRKGAGILPGDVARTIFGTNSEGAESLQAGRPEIAKDQRKMIAAAGLLPPVAYLGNIDAKGTEHAVRFRGVLVEKHQHADGWAPMMDKSGMLVIHKALPTEYPLVLCFHGAKGRGTDNLARGSLAYPVLSSEPMQRKHPAFVVAPQCPPGGKRWVNHNWSDGAYDSKKVVVSEEMILALSIVDELVATLPVDKTRIYVTGRSMGGYATWDAITRRPDFFAGAVPIAGGGDPRMAGEWKDLPIWAFASAGDTTCPVSGTREVVEALKKVNGMIKYTEDPTKSHGEICLAWEEQKDLADWLFSQRRSKP